MEDQPSSRDPLFAYDATMRILLWSGEAERLTGIGADDAVGRWFWEVLRAVDERGRLVSGPDPSAARPPAGRAVPSNRLVIQTENGRKLVTVSTIAVQRTVEEPIVLQLLRNGDLVSDNGTAESVPLAPRQREVLQLLANGIPAKLIATRLGIAEMTVRNHIHAILGELTRLLSLGATIEPRLS
jgi:PAS domain-containing protein